MHLVGPQVVETDCRLGQHLSWLCPEAADVHTGMVIVSPGPLREQADLHHGVSDGRMPPGLRGTDVGVEKGSGQEI